MQDRTVPSPWKVALVALAAAFGDHGVSIKSVRQEGRGDRAAVHVVTHRAPEAQQRSAVDAVHPLDVAAEVGAVSRVESDES